MQFTIPIKPLSINDAYTGIRRRSDLYQQFESDLCKTLKLGDYNKECTDELYVVYIFHIYGYNRIDVGNLEKTLTDTLTHRGYFNDDRYIKSFFLIKEKAKKRVDERIEVFITSDSSEYWDTIKSHVPFPMD